MQLQRQVSNSLLASPWLGFEQSSELHRSVDSETIRPADYCAAAKDCQRVDPEVVRKAFILDGQERCEVVRVDTSITPARRQRQGMRRCL